MPTSSLSLFEPVMRAVMSAKPKSILEVGCGCGVYGVAMRVFVESAKYNHSKVDDWCIELVGIEPCVEFANPAHGVYTKVYWESMQDVLPEMLERDCMFDVVVASQVFEHLEKNEALSCLTMCRRLGKFTVVMVPYGHSPQRSPANDFDIHRSLWSPSDFLGGHVEKIGRDIMAVYGVLGDSYD